MAYNNGVSAVGTSNIPVRDMRPVKSDDAKSNSVLDHSKDQESGAKSVSIVNTNIAKNRERVEEYEEQVKEESAEKDDSKEVISNISSEDLEKLTRMQVDITNMSAIDIKGFLMSINSANHRAKVYDTVKSVIENMQLDKELVTRQGNKNVDTTNLLESIGARDEEADNKLIDDSQAAYILKNDLKLTIKNIYTSQFSSAKGPDDKVLSDSELEDMKDQIDKVIYEAGYEPDDNTYKAAGFILSNEIAFTATNLTTYMAIDDINNNGLHMDLIDRNINYQNSKGMEDIDANIYYECPEILAADMVDRISDISDEDIIKTIARDKSYSLINYMQADNYEKVSEEEYTDIEQSDIYVNKKRQLEEVRLMMTYESAVAMYDKDIHVDIKAIEDVISELKQMAYDTYSTYLKNEDVDPSVANVDIFAETTYKVNALGYMPAYSLGIAVTEGVVTIDSLYEQGIKDKQKLANEAYETMATTPRSDMGDSINKAFRNIGELLDTLGLDKNIYNEKAVRILSYNNMDVTKDNIDKVKSVDAQVNFLMDNMKPDVCLSLIREGINPLNMSVEELNEHIRQIKQDMNSSNKDDNILGDEGYAQFLYKLDKSHDVTEEERQSYIGIYRLLDKIDKSDGRDIGFVVKSNAELTLNNLLAANRSKNDKGIDITIDADFGLLESSNKEGYSIDEQVNMAYNLNMTSKILNSISPEKLAAEKQIDFLDFSLEDMAEYMENASSDETLSKEYIDETQALINEAARVYEDVKAVIGNYDIKPTLQNVIAANTVAYEAGSIFKDVKGINSNLVDDITGGIEEAFDNADDFGDVTLVYGKQAESVKDYMSKLNEQNTITWKDLAALKTVSAGFNILQSMSSTAGYEKYYQVPVDIDGSINVINLTIVSGGEDAGKIRASVDTAKYGKIVADIVIEDEHIAGSIYSDKKEGQEKLEKSSEEIRVKLSEGGKDASKITFENNYDDASANGVAKMSELLDMAKMLVGIIKNL